MKPSHQFLIGTGLLIVSAIVYGVLSSEHGNPAGMGKSSRAELAPPVGSLRSTDGSKISGSATRNLEHDIAFLKAEVAHLRKELSATNRLRERIHQFQTLQSDLVLLRAEVEEMASALARPSTPFEADLDAAFLATPQADYTYEEDELPLSEINALVEAQQAQQQERMRQRMDAIAASFRLESVDRGWSADTAELIQTALASDELNDVGRIESECRSTLCRLDVAHEDPARMEEFIWVFTDMVADSLPQMTMEQVHHDDGSIDSILYLVREGHSLPQFE